MKNIFLIVLTALLIFSGMPSKLLAQQYNFRNYSVEEGLAQSQVYAMCEDNTGNIWLGTRGGGLSRFDGISFTNYSINEGLPSNFIRSILKDKDGNLWIGTDMGLARYNGKLFLNFNSKRGLYNETVNALMQDRKGVIWIATEKGIFQFEKDTVVRFGRKLGLPQERVTCLYEDAKGSVWAGTEKGLLRFDFSNNQWSFQALTKKEGLPGNIITCIQEDDAKRLWIATYEGGVAYLSESGFKRFTLKEGLASNTVFTCFRGDQRELWFGTANGVTKLLVEGDSLIFKTFTHTEGLSNNVVMCGMKDSFGNTWFGTSGGGVCKLGTERFVHYTSIPDVFGNWVYSILQDKKGNMWFGTSEGGVTHYDGKFYKRFSQKDGFTASKVKCIHEDALGNIWFGTISDGAYVFDGKKFKHYTSQSGLTSNFINYMVSDTSGRVWLATAGGGINYLEDPRKNTYKFRSIKQKNGLANDRVNSLAIDNSGNVWAGTAGGGVSKIIPSKDSLPVKILNFNSKDGLTSNHIRSIAISDNGLIYFGTADAGVMVYDSQKFYLLDKKKGLASNNIYSLIFDNSNQLWVGTEKGIDRVTFVKETFEVEKVSHYGKTEGFVGIETIQNSVFRDANGDLWFGSIKCATVYRASKDVPLKKPLIHISGISLFFDKLENTEFGKKINPWYSLPEDLILPHDKNHLSFQFIGIEHSNPEAVRYRWTLEGFEDKWSPWSQRREAVYSNLPPGNYTFKVTAANELDIQSEKAAEFSFQITPPWWRTWWFRILFFICIIALIWFLISSRYKKARKENLLERQRLEAERNLMELEQKALRLQMNPHFLFNCLNSIKGLIAEKKSEEAKLYLSKFSKLMRVMLDNSREEFVSLDQEMNALQNYVELEKLSMDDKLEFTMHLKESLDRENIGIPPMLIQPFIENAIVHGIAPKTGKGFIKVEFSKADDLIKCSIEDNGVGREESGRLKKESVHSHKSSAIAITQERLNIINKKLNYKEVKIKILDLKDEASRPHGTKVELLIPFKYL